MSQVRSDFSVGVAAKFCGAWCDAGGTTTELNSFAENNGQLQSVLSVIRGFSEIKVVEHMIDLDADPFVPEGWKVEEHKKGGKWKFDPKRVKFHLSKSQTGINTVTGNELRKELANVPVMNANTLDWCLAHPEFIPEGWKGKAVFFWGTVYRNSVGDLCVRYLYWDGGRWDWHYLWLENHWSFDFPALVLAS